MVKNWFIADTHFDHGNIIKYCRRPFVNSRELEMMAMADAGKLDPRQVRISRESVDWMNTVMIDNINARAGRDDILWHGGDAFWGNDFRRARELRDRINCQNINLIWGNHDEPTFRPLFSEAYQQILITVEKQQIFLNHLPCRTWYDPHKTYMLYGHVHQLYAEEDRLGDKMTLDIGVDGHDFKPWSMEELHKYMAPKRVLALEHRNKERQARKPSQNKSAEPEENSPCST